MRGDAPPLRGGGADSIVDSRPLGAIPVAAGASTVQLPPGAARYRYLDLSIQQPGDGSRHSGRSVLRVPLGRALAG